MNLHLPFYRSSLSAVTHLQPIETPTADDKPLPKLCPLIHRGATFSFRLPHRGLHSDNATHLSAGARDISRMAHQGREIRRLGLHCQKEKRRSPACDACGTVQDAGASAYARVGPAV